MTDHIAMVGKNYLWLLGKRHFGSWAAVFLILGRL
ncbi:MAG: hypothetical protein ACI82H_001997 [Alphaproteobacteria bacterium]|jgi:hypothetical protein